MKSIECFYVLGNKYFHEKDSFPAIELYSMALKKSPDDTRILTTRAECYLQINFPKLALADCNRILEITEKTSTESNDDWSFTWKVYYRRLRALIALQAYEEAKSSLELFFRLPNAIASSNIGIVNRFRRIIQTDIPNLQEESKGNYDMIQLINDRTSLREDDHAEFELKDAFVFRACDQPVRKPRTVKSRQMNES